MTAPSLSSGKSCSTALHHDRGIRAILVIDRRVEGDPDEIGIGNSGRVGGERQEARRRPGLDQIVETRLEQRRLTARQAGDDVRIGIQTNGREPGPGQAGGRNRAQVPEALNADLHGSRPIGAICATVPAAGPVKSRRKWVWRKIGGVPALFVGSIPWRVNSGVSQHLQRQRSRAPGRRSAETARQSGAPRGN